MKMASICKKLNRSQSAVKRRCQALGIRANDTGLMTFYETARHFGTSYHRIKAMVDGGHIKAIKRKSTHFWQIDIETVKPEVIAHLTRPKLRYRDTPMATESYEKRYNLKTTKIDGRTVRVPRS